MQVPRRRLPPRERRNAAPRHPIGRARRRWPRAYDGGDPERAKERLNPRYHRAFERDGSTVERRRRIPTTLQRLRESPVRNGLIGLAIAGVAAPVAINRYQEALRTDPAHERVRTKSAQKSATDAAVSRAWRAMETARAERQSAIEQNLQKYREYDITRDLAEDIYDFATQEEIDPDVAFGLVRAESSFRNTSTSPVGAVGLTQLMPGTADWVEPGTSASELRDQKTNLRIGFKYLRKLLDKYSGDTKLALLAYNRGPGTVDRALKRGADPDNGYADFVFGVENHGHTLFTR